MNDTLSVKKQQFTAYKCTQVMSIFNGSLSNDFRMVYFTNLWDQDWDNDSSGAIEHC